MRKMRGFVWGLSLALALALCGQGLAQMPAPDSESHSTLSSPAGGAAPPAAGVPSAAPADAVAPLSPLHITAGRQGVLAETLDGRPVMSQAADEAFNPASGIKLATALAALSAFGPEHRFATVVWMNGTLDQATGTVRGDLIIAGRDPSFHHEHAIMLARELNRLSIRRVTGDLIVPPRFSLNFNPSALRSGEMLYDTLDVSRRSATATRAWYDSRIAAGDTDNLATLPSVAVLGAVYVDSVPAGARNLLTHRSSKLTDILKVLLCYSNNFLAERIGDTVGGPAGIRRRAAAAAGISEAEVMIATASGLGINRVTPRAMLRIYRALLAELEQHDLTAADIMPVAGIDPGTLQRRYQMSPGRGSIIGKTGTLVRTDSGASALVGQMRARNGETILFVIFNHRGNVNHFRATQDRLLAALQNARGGPQPFAYRPHTLAMRLADTELERTPADEYEH